jgi:glutaredoxin-like YruB-family protein
MLSKIISAVCVVGLFSIPCLAADQTHQSQLSPARAQDARKYPQIVLYSVAWCPHCKETKEYFTKNNIPFINRDVEIDAKAMDELTGKYNSNGVPVIVIGTGKSEVVVKGFTPELFQDSLKKAQAKN